MGVAIATLWRRRSSKGEIALQEDRIIAQTRRWIDRFVVDMNLCPFARRELELRRLRFTVVNSPRPDELLKALATELLRLQDEPAIETTLLIHPAVLLDFLEYNAFLDICDQLLRDLDLEGVFQIASFHPAYQFAGTAPDDAENFSNRSPYPMLHLLREESVARAVNSHPDVQGIPERNIATLNDLGEPALRRLRQRCLDS